MRTDEAPSRGQRRVVVTGSRHGAAGHVVHDALSQAWAGGGGVLVTSTHPTVADRYAELLWRRWGGQVQRQEPGWRLHRARGGAARRTWDNARHTAGADVSVSFIPGGVRVSEHDRTASVLGGARHAMRRHQPGRRQPGQDQLELGQPERWSPRGEIQRGSGCDSEVAGRSGPVPQRPAARPVALGGFESPAEPLTRAVPVDQTAGLEGEDPDAVWFADTYDLARLRAGLSELETSGHPETRHVHTLRRAVELARRASDQAVAESSRARASDSRPTTTTSCSAPGEVAEQAAHEEGVGQ